LRNENFPALSKKGFGSNILHWHIILLKQLHRLYSEVSPAALLTGLGANYLFGFRQADPVAGFVIVAFL